MHWFFGEKKAMHAGYPKPSPQSHAVVVCVRHVDCRRLYILTLSPAGQTHIRRDATSDQLCAGYSASTDSGVVVDTVESGRVSFRLAGF